MNLFEPLATRAELTPLAPAIVDATRRRERIVNFRRFAEDASRLAGRLAARGLRPGDRVLVLVPMSLELYLALAALFRLGPGAAVRGSDRRPWPARELLPPAPATGA